MAPLPPVAYRRAAPRTSSAGTPVTSAMASGEFFGCDTKSRHFWNGPGSQRSATNASLTRPSVTTTCASELISATLVPGRSCRW